MTSRFSVMRHELAHAEAYRILGGGDEFLIWGECKGAKYWLCQQPENWDETNRIYQAASILAGPASDYLYHTNGELTTWEALKRDIEDLPHSAHDFTDIHKMWLSDDEFADAAAFANRAAEEAKNWVRDNGDLFAEMVLESTFSDGLMVNMEKVRFSAVMNLSNLATPAELAKLSRIIQRGTLH